MNRRSFLRSLAGTSLILPGALSELLGATPADDPLAQKSPHFSARAKRVIFLHMSGGVSHVDSFDYKPQLIAAHSAAARQAARRHAKTNCAALRVLACPPRRERLAARWWRDGAEGLAGTLAKAARLTMVDTPSGPRLRE